MKRLLVLLLVIALPLSLCFCQESWYYGSLTPVQQIAYDAFYDCLCHLRPQWNCGTIDQQNLKIAYDAMTMDHPEVFWSDGFVYVTRYVDNEISGHYVEFDYTMDKNEIQRRNDEILSAILKLVEQLEIDFPLDGTLESSYEAVRKVYSHFVSQCEYDEMNMDQSLYSALIGGNGVCASFSKAFQFVMQCLGFECCTVRGYLKQSLGPYGQPSLGSVLGHEWNLIRIDDKWYHVDVTSGLGISGSEVDYGFLFCTTQQIQKTHAIDNVLEIPVCDDESLDFYRYNGLVLDSYSREDAKSCFDKCLKLGRNVLEVKFEGFSALSKAKEDLISQQNLFQILSSLGIETGERLNYFVDEEALVLKVYLNSNILD